MNAPAARARMSADEFIAWAMNRPEGEPRHELVAGEVVAMAPGRAAHAQAKFRVTRAFDDAIAARGLPCQAFVDGLSVRVDDATVYEPDALVRCGAEPVDPDAVVVDDPIVVVEVVSPSSANIDAGGKLDDYFRVPSIRHYLIVKTKNRTVIHHARDAADGQIRTAILREGTLELDPPGLAVAVEAFFP